MIKFGYTITYVANVDETLDFFEKAFGMQRRFITEEKDYGELNTGETVLAFASHELGKSNIPGGYVSASDSEKPLGIELALVTDDVQVTHEHALQYGATEINPPKTKPWGQVVSYVRSPSGLLLELCSPLG